MAKQRIFQTLEDQVRKSHRKLPEEQRATFWFRNYATTLATWRAKYSHITYPQLVSETFTKQAVTRTAAMPGFFYFYLYDPKLKKTLPYYDTFPLTLVLNRYDDGFLGLNFHYLPLQWRARFFDALYPLRYGRPSRPGTRDIRMRLRVTYAILKTVTKYKPYRPCIKRYLFSHVQTPLLKVGAAEWDKALFLPVERFVKDTKEHAWSYSLAKF